MAEVARKRGEKIGVITNLQTTLGPTVCLLKRTAEKLKKEIQITEKLCEGAFDLLEYYLNRITGSLRTKSTKIIGIIVSDIKNPIYTEITEIVEIIQKELDYLGFSIILCESEGYPETSDQITGRAIDAAK